MNFLRNLFGKKQSTANQPNQNSIVMGDGAAEWMFIPLHCPKCSTTLHEHTPRFATIRCGTCGASFVTKDFQPKFEQEKSEQKQSEASVFSFRGVREGKQEICVDVNRLKAILLYVVNFDQLLSAIGQDEMSFFLYILKTYDPLVLQDIVSREQAGDKYRPVTAARNVDEIGTPSILVQDYCNQFGVSDYHLLAQCTKITLNSGRTFDLCLAFVAPKLEGEIKDYILQNYSGMKSTILVPV